MTNKPEGKKTTIHSYLNYRHFTKNKEMLAPILLRCNHTCPHPTFPHDTCLHAYLPALSAEMTLGHVTLARMPNFGSLSDTCMHCLSYYTTCPHCRSHLKWRLLGLFLLDPTVWLDGAIPCQHLYPAQLPLNQAAVFAHQSQPLMHL